MSSNNVCQECKKTYDRVPKQCMCGWYFIKSEPQKNNPALCQHFPNGVQCDELGTVSLSIRGNTYYCGDHARELREKSYKK